MNITKRIRYWILGEVILSSMIIEPEIKPKDLPLDIFKQEMSEKTILELCQTDHWVEAIMLSTYIDPQMYTKVTSNYLEKHANGNPLYTLLLLNQCKPEQVFVTNPKVINHWNHHVSFLLQNIESCNSVVFFQFLNILLNKLQLVLLCLL